MRRALSQTKERSFGCIIEEGTKEKVSTRIARDGELREGNDLYPLSLRFEYLSFYPLDIIFAVCDPHEGNSSCYLDKSILHITFII